MVARLFADCQQFCAHELGELRPLCYSCDMPKLTNLKAVREKKFITQRDLAATAKVSPTTVSRLEALQVDAQFGTIRKLAEALGVAPEELL
jgi:predicted transcriptional regulator